MTDLRTRLTAVVATPEGRALIEKGHQFSIEELQAAFTQALQEAEGDQRAMIESAYQRLDGAKGKLEMTVYGYSASRSMLKGLGTAPIPNGDPRPGSDMRAITNARQQK